MMKKLFTILFLSSFLFMACAPTDKGDAKSGEGTEVKEMKPEILGEEISYEADSVTMKGYLAYDKNLTGKRPCVLVVHEWWGHNDYARMRADKLAELGYIALAVDMYGDGKQAEHPADAGKFATAVFSNFNGAQARFNKALETLKAHPMADAEKTAAIGYCFGGGVVLNMARLNADLDAVVSFHGSLGAAVKPAKKGAVNAKILVCNGAADPFVKPEEIKAFKLEMDSAEVEYMFIDLPDAVHAFTNPGATALGEEFNLPLAYNEKADKISWKTMTEFFEKNLK